MTGKLHNHPISYEIILWLIPFIAIIIFYVQAVQHSNQNYRKWPLYRTILFITGVIFVALSIVGPIAEQSHSNFVYHMYSHLLLGMLAPLLITLSAPMTLLLRSVPVLYARKVSKILKSRYLQTISHPVIATLLNLGGLWVLYTTNLFEAMHHSMLLAILVHVHIFLAGYVFTISIIYIDPTPHRTSYMLRSVMIIFYMAGHSILSKWVYANPPVGVSKLEAELGGMIMYYGGDLIDVIIIIILLKQFYKSTNNKKTTTLLNKYRLN